MRLLQMLENVILREKLPGQAKGQAETSAAVPSCGVPPLT
jgi:hypothetical protein